MNTRSNQTVCDSRLIADVYSSKSDSKLQLRCLYAGQDLARFIVVDSTDIQKNNYQIQILAEARYNFKRNHLSFKSQALSNADSEILKDKIYVAAAQVVQRDCGIALFS